MDSHRKELDDAILDVGREDWIPLFELLSTPEVTDVLNERDAESAVRSGLLRLLDRGLIRVYKGDWRDDDPSRVPDQEARAVLAESHWYRIDMEMAERVSFVSLANIRPDSR